MEEAVGDESAAVAGTMKKKKKNKTSKIPIKIYSHSRGRSPPTADDVNRDTRDDTPSPLANLLLGLLSSGALAEAISDILGAADGGDE